jgi:hypothetical protein
MSYINHDVSEVIETVLFFGLNAPVVANIKIMVCFDTKIKASRYHQNSGTCPTKSKASHLRIS